MYERWHELAIERTADVELLTVLHDIARIKGVGPVEEHNIYGTKLAEKMLKKYNYPKEKNRTYRKMHI